MNTPYDSTPLAPTVEELHGVYMVPLIDCKAYSHNTWLVVDTTIT